jgi:thiol reductant ABC exporter CydC subunit
VIRRLTRLAGVGPARVAPSIALGALAVLFGVGLMATAGYLISRAAERPPILSLTIAIVAVRFFGLARPLARYLERLASHDVALRALGRVRARFYEAIEPLAPARLEGYRRGELLDRMVGDVDALQGLYLRALGPPVVAALAGAVCVGAVAALLPAGAVVLAAGLLAGGLLVPALAARFARPSERRAAARGELTAELVELLRGAPEIVANGREDDTLARIRAADAELVRLGRRDALAAGVADSLSIVVAGATTAAVLALAIAAPVDRVLVAALALLALASFESVAVLPTAARELGACLASGRRVLELADREPAVREPAAPLAAPGRRPTVALEGVSVRSLVDTDLTLAPGRRVALVGPSGAGKTTVTSLLVRFLDPDRGRVTIDGNDVRDHRLEDVRATFALAGQDAHVFNASVRDNLLLARPGATDEKLTDALRRARLTDLNLDTAVGEDGAALSGGQRQRLVVARALLSDAPVLVLDEPTAHLDVATAEALLDDVLEASADRTVLLVTHRPERLDRMDEVVTLR